MGWGTFCHLCFNYFELLESFHSELEGSDGKHLKVLFSLGDWSIHILPDSTWFCHSRGSDDAQSPWSGDLGEIESGIFGASGCNWERGRGECCTDLYSSIHRLQTDPAKVIIGQWNPSESGISRSVLRNFANSFGVNFPEPPYSDIDMWVTWGSIFAAVLPHVPGTWL